MMRSLVAAVVLALTTASLPAAGEGPAGAMLGQPAPPFSLTDLLSGETVSLEQLRGSFVVLHFAASWCPYCNAEAPHLQELSESYADRGVRAVIVDVMEPKQVAEAWVKKSQFTFPVLLDPDGAVTESYAPPGALPDLPRNQVPVAANLIIDREGIVRFYSLLDSMNFDARLIGVKGRLDELLDAEP